MENAATRHKHAGDEPAATIAADRIMHPILRRHLTRNEKKLAEPIVHHRFASALGSAYGATAEYAPVIKKLCGVPFGAVVFAGADEFAVPALKLSRNAREYPLSTHLGALSSHVVFGLTSELVRRGVRRALGS